MISTRLTALAAMLTAVVIWGTTFVVVHWALESIPVFHLLAFRFVLGVLVVTPWLRLKRPGQRLWRGGTRGLARDGALIGGVLFVAFALQTFGLVWTTPSRSAFLTGLSVVLVPFLARIFFGTALRLVALLGTGATAAGLWVLYQPGLSGDPFNRGDLLTIVGSVAYALHVLLVEGAARRHPVRPLAAAQFAVVALLSLPSLVVRPPVATELTGLPLLAVLVTGLLATGLAFTLQLSAQRTLSAVEVAVILTLEPLFAALFSVAMGVEAASPAMLLGGALILAGMLVVEIRGTPPAPAIAPSPSDRVE